MTIAHFWNYGNLREIFRSVERTVAPESHCPTLQSATGAGKDSRLQAQPRMGISGMNRSRNFDGPPTARLNRYRLVLGAAVRNHAASTAARDRFLVKARSSEIGRLNTCSRTASGSNDKWWQTHVRLPIDLSLEANHARADFATRSGPERSCTA